MATSHAHVRGPWGEPEDEQKWRQGNLQWTPEYYQATKVSLAARRPKIGEVSAYNVLMVGCIKAGKSSVITSMMTALRDEYGQYAASGAQETTITKTLKKFIPRFSNGSRIAVNLWDTMGFEECVAPAGPTIRDMEYIMEGHIKDGYRLDPKESISFHSEHFRPSPQKSDKMHVVVIVVPASSISMMHIDVQAKLKQVIEMARDKDIRVGLLLTKCDEACEQVKADLTRVMRRRPILKAAQDAEEKLGINLNNVFVIKNYHEELQSEQRMNILALDSLQHILNLADSTIEAQYGELLEQQEREAAITPLLESPWRPSLEFTKEELDSKWAELTDLTVDGVPSLNLCLLGAIGSGKSAFINSVLSEFYQRIVTTAFTGCSDAHTPNTTSFSKFRVCLGDPSGQETAMTLCDTMGVAAPNDMGMCCSDVDLVLDGHFAHREVFNSIVAKAKPSEEAGPFEECMHLVLLVVDGTKMDNLQGLEPKLKDIIKKARDRSIPVCALATNMDLVCSHVRADPQTLFKSDDVNQCVEKISRDLGIPRPRIFPVVNFHNDTEIEWKKSWLIVDALTTMTQCAHDYVKERKKDQGGRRTSGMFATMKNMIVG